MDAAMLRGAEQRRLRGSYDKLSQATHWQPTIDLSQILGDMLEFWLGALR